jgi:hypothetical protein
VREDQCCNTCEEVREAYRLKGWSFQAPDQIEQCKREHFSENLQAQKNEGCHVWGHMMVNKVAGNFHVAPGKSFLTFGAHVHDMKLFGDTKFDLSHKSTRSRLAFRFRAPSIRSTTSPRSPTPSSRA